MLPPHHTRTRRLTHEQLEPRVVLSGNPVTPLPDVDVTPSNTALDAHVAPADEATLQNAVTLDRFASAEELKQHLIDDALKRWAHLFGERDDFVYPCGDTTDTFEFAHSQTNVQVTGVDEPDLMETDGRFLYSLAPQELIIREIGDGAQPTIVARLALGDGLRGMLLSGDRLTILAQRNKTLDPKDPYKPETEVVVFDVADPTNPSLVERTFVDGAYTDARAIGDRVYLVSQSDFYLPRPLVKGGNYVGVYEPGVFETKEEYLARIEDKVLELVLPAIKSLDGDREIVDSGWLAEPTEIYRPQSDQQNQLNNVVVLDIGDDQAGPLDAIVVAADSATEIYLSSDGLYILGTELPLWGGWGWQPFWQNGSGQDTSILKFSLDEENGELALAAAGNVPGHLLDQFSFDSHDGSLRIATTIGAGSESRNALYVLQQDGNALEVVGKIEDIAPGERLYSARFLGDQGYLVTFERVDPLYSIDLTEPTNPQIVGELKIPGFSNYLQSLGGGFLLGLGRDADANTGYYADPKISLFDVSDLSAPKLAADFTIPTGRRGSLNLFDDHHEIAYFPEHGILTLVAPTTDESGGQGVWVLRIDTSATAIESGNAIEHVTTITHEEAYAYRAARMGDRLVVSSGRQVTVHDLASPGAALGSDESHSIWLSDSSFYKTTMPSLADSDYLFTLEASNTGYLTFDALFERTDQKDATFTLYDSQMNELAVSESDYPWAQARLDWQAEAGQRFYLRVSGSAEDVELRVVNAVSIDGELQDSVLRILGPGYLADVDFEIYWHGEGGTPWKDGLKTQAFARRLSLTIGGIHYDIPMHTPHVVIEGMGQNALTVDVAEVGSLSGPHGEIVADLGDGSGTISVSGGVFGTTGDGDEIGFEMTINNFREITVNGGDVAKLRGSEHDDLFTVQPGTATMETPGRVQRVNDFRAVHGYSSPGQRDTARLYDTTGDDRFVATPYFAKMRGQDYYARAKGFRYAHGYAIAGGHDSAVLKDSPDQDVCVVKPDYVRMRGVAHYARSGKGLECDYSNRAKYFDEVEVRARGDADDTVALRDAVLTTLDSNDMRQDELQTSVLIRGMERFKFRGNATDERSETESVDLLLAYWPE
jgi:hypothetical protein